MSAGLAIRLAKATDRDALLEFLREHWSREHVFCRWPELFDWQHHDPRSPERFSYVLAEDTATSAIHGVLGFIPAWRFDPHSDSSDLFLAIWKTRAGSSPGLGLSLLRHLTAATGCGFVGAIGLSEEVLPLYSALGYTVGRLDHFVRVNPRVAQFTIAGGTVGAAARPRASVPDTVRVQTIEACALQSADLAPLFTSHRPRKSAGFVRQRYLEHPSYTYSLALLLDGGDDRPRALLVWRRVEHAGASALRVVDIIGDEHALAEANHALDALLEASGAEYMDVYCHGVARDALEGAGFVMREPGSEMIVPGYFEPFERRNVELTFAYRVVDDSSVPVRLMRGDSDQDRPNLPPPGAARGETTDE